MDKICTHNVRETKRGAGPCVIDWEVRKRSGRPKWWCRTHGLEAAAPDGTSLDTCSAGWLDPVSDDMRHRIDVSRGEIAVWGAIPPAIRIGAIPDEEGSGGSVHLHSRSSANGPKEIDRSFDIVEAQRGDHIEIIEGMAAQAYAISNLTRQEVQPLRCPHCDETHIDELIFAAEPHRKHQCNNCGREFWHHEPSISNPLSGAQARLGLPEPAPAQRVSRPLDICSQDYSAIAVWPSNSAAITTMSRPEDEGLHVHAWDKAGNQVTNETYSPVTLDGRILDEENVRMLAVQRILAAKERAPIVSLACQNCGQPLLSPTEGWLRPTTRHVCACGAETRTRRKCYLNPLADEA